MSFSGVRFELTEEKIQTQKKLYCVSVLNKRSFEPFCVWILFQNASSHSLSAFYSFVELKHAVIFMTMTDKIPVCICGSVTEKYTE